MRFALIISIIMLSLSLSAYGQSPAPAEIPSPAPTVAASPEASPTPEVAPTPVAAATPDPMDPQYQRYYPRSETDKEKDNPGGDWKRGPYGKMEYVPPVRERPARASRPTVTTTRTATTTTVTQPTVTVTTGVNVTLNTATEGDVPAPRATTTTTTTTTAPKKAATSWNWNWFWSSLKFLGALLLLATVAAGVWAVGRRWGRPAGATAVVAIASLAILVWLNL